jgi:hypothetical protein
VSARSDQLWRVFAGFRRVVIFLLGVLVFLKGTFYDDYSVPELIVGMIMVGVLPVENLFGWHRDRRDRDTHDES